MKTEKVKGLKGWSVEASADTGKRRARSDAPYHRGLSMRSNKSRLFSDIIAYSRVTGEKCSKVVGGSTEQFTKVTIITIIALRSFGEIREFTKFAM